MLAMALHARVCKHALCFAAIDVNSCAQSAQHVERSAFFRRAQGLCVSDLRQLLLVLDQLLRLRSTANWTETL